MGSRDAEHTQWNLAYGLKPNEHLALVCPRCARPHAETLTNDPAQPDYHHHVHQCTYCGLRFDLFVRCRSVPAEPETVLDRTAEVLRAAVVAEIVAWLRKEARHPPPHPVDAEVMARAVADRIEAKWGAKR